MLDKPTIFQQDRFANDRKELRIHHHIVLNLRAAFAANILEKWALVAGRVEGEDSAGRSIIRNMPASEAVDFACNAADEAFNEFEKRGWLVEVPLPGKEEG